ncbi:MAG: sulfotransferase domain-containing protein [Paracoccaceae bacterium]
MIIINAGVPRSGTVLVNSIIRNLFQDVTPSILQENPNEDELLPLLKKIISNGEDKTRPCLIHTHSWSKEISTVLAAHSNKRVLVNYRDPRDVAVSLMKLHDHDFEYAARLTEASFAQIAKCIRGTHNLALPYELLIPGKRLAIYQIAQFLGFRPSMRQISIIDEETSIENHRSIMKSVQDGTLKTIIRKHNSNRVLAEDSVTLINDRHIQSGASGRWREEFPSTQHELITGRFTHILDNFGYE